MLDRKVTGVASGMPEGMQSEFDSGHPHDLGEVELSPTWDPALGEFVWGQEPGSDDVSVVDTGVAQGRMAGSGWDEIDAYFADAENGAATGKSIEARPGGELVVVDKNEATEASIGAAAQGRMA